MANKETVLRREVAKCEPDRANAFIINLKKNNYICRSEKRADGNVHQDRYKFMKGTEKISVVYDTKGKKLCMDAVYEVLNSLEELLNGTPNSAADNAQSVARAIVTPQVGIMSAPSVSSNSQKVITQSKPSENNRTPFANITQKEQVLVTENEQNKLPPQKIKLPPKQEKKPITELAKPQIIQVEPPKPPQTTLGTNQNQVAKPPQTTLGTNQNQVSKPPQTAVGEPEKVTVPQNNPPRLPRAKAKPKVAAPITAPNSTIAPQTITAQPAVSVQAVAPTELEYKNGFSVKKISAAKLEKFIEKVNLLPSIKMLENNTKTSGIISYIFEDKAKQRVTVRYVEAAMVVQLQGKRSNLFSEMQVLISRDTDYLEAVGSHIVLVNENKKAGEIHKLLKKRIPDAYNFLSDQSKIDMTYGLIDINNEKVFLSDYSVLLVPPYRGLEKFIYDLQQAKEITVKMIGQAFDKDDGKYVLKSGYRKKINSVIYEEVLTSLYTEYFEKRNFYAHSDCTESGVNRGISDKSVAKNIFDNLLDTVNYNCKKLKEINFEINPKQK